MSTRTGDNLQIPDAELASSPAPQNLKFEREDWSLFRTVEGLQQKAGVPKHKLRRLVLKELADNGLDDGARGPRRRAAQAAATSSRTTAAGSTARRKRSPGCSASPARWSRPSCCGCRRGARSATACGSSPVPSSPPAARSSSSPAIAGSCSAPSATAPRRSSARRRSSIRSAPASRSASARRSRATATPCTGRRSPASWRSTGQTYAGKSSPWWYDAAQFHELLYASGNTPVRELIAQLDGCTGGKAGEIVAAGEARPRALQGRHPRAGREAAAGCARERQAGDARAARSRGPGRVRRLRLRLLARSRPLRRGRAAGRNPLRRRGVGRSKTRAKRA